MSESKPGDSAGWIAAIVACSVVGCILMTGCACLMGGLIVSTALPGPNRVWVMPTASSNPDMPVTPSSLEGLEPLRDSDYVGLWQFGENWAWIKITQQGQAFQCRVARDGTVYRSEGILTEGDQITWQQNWGVDQIRRKANMLFLKGEHGEFGYGPAVSEMKSACEPPF